MALVQFKDEINNVSITRRMSAPKKVTRLDHWYKAARKTIPQIPDLLVPGTSIINTQCTFQWITWEVKDEVGNRSYVVINRRIDSF